MKSATTPSHFQPARELQHLPLGELLRSSGKLSEPDIGRIVVLQRAQNIRFGQAAELLGLVAREDVDQALARQFDYPYVGAAESKLSPLLVTAHEPFSARAEVVRALRGQLTLRWFTDRRKTLAIVAPRREAGASVVAANLAIAFAQLGERTLLIDADLRRPSLHTLFGISRAEGLSHLLAGRAQFKQVLNTVPPFSSLALMCSGAPAPNPNELLSGIAFSYLMETAPAAFDIVIVDCPPLLEYPDGQVIAARATGSLLATRRHMTSIGDVETAKRLLEPTGGTVVGVVIND